MTLTSVRRGVELENAGRRALLYVIVPIWFAAGLADWYQHRKTRIETTSGARESVLHLLMQAEAGLPAILGLVFRLNAGTLLAGFAAVVAHELTVYWDISYTQTKRSISPLEQHIHSYLQMGPIMTMTFLSVLHSDQLLSLLGRGPDRPEFRLELKRPAAEPPVIGALLVGALACGFVPYLEELWRCVRTSRRQK
jgi:hypothetical protein